MTGRPAINLRSSVPPYQQVADNIRARIADGEWAAGERLPAHTTLGHELGVSKHTISRALTRLVHEGLLEPGRGSGHFVRDPWPVRTVDIPAGAVLTARMPTPAERQALDIDEGVPVIVVRHAGTSTPYAADRFEFRGR